MDLLLAYSGHAQACPTTLTQPALETFRHGHAEVGSAWSWVSHETELQCLSSYPGLALCHPARVWLAQPSEIRTMWSKSLSSHCSLLSAEFLRPSEKTDCPPEPVKALTAAALCDRHLGWGHSWEETGRHGTIENHTAWWRQSDTSSVCKYIFSIL